MRHVITVVGSQEMLRQGAPVLQLRDGEGFQETTWYAATKQDPPVKLLDDSRSLIVRLMRVPVLAYRFYLLVYNTKLWSGRRPLILVRGRSLSSRVAAYAGRWGGGDVVMPSESGKSLLGPTRYLLLPDGSLELRAD
jgi:hypothetical protein